MDLFFFVVVVFSEYTFSWGSQNAIMTGSVASVRLVRRANIVYYSFSD